MGVHKSKMANGGSEKVFKEKIQKEVRSRGGFVYLTIEAFKSGVPDLFVCINGKSLWVELKWIDEGETLSHKVSLQQSKFLADINSRGGIGYVLVGRGSDGTMWLERPMSVSIIGSLSNMQPITSVEELWKEETGKTASH